MIIPIYVTVFREVNKICSSDCWKTGRKDCPYWSVCSSFVDEDHPDEYERTRAFELAMIARYNEIHKEEITA